MGTRDLLGPSPRPSTLPPPHPTSQYKCRAEAEGQGCWKPLGLQSGWRGELCFQLGAHTGDPQNREAKGGGQGAASIVSWAVG